MTRPLVITDCDEVLMHMVVPFAQWVDEEHGVIFRMEDTSFAGALKRKECGTPLEAAEVWPLLDGFFCPPYERSRHALRRPTARRGRPCASAPRRNR